MWVRPCAGGPWLGCEAPEPVTRKLISVHFSHSPEVIRLGTARELQIGTAQPVPVEWRFRHACLAPFASRVSMGVILVYTSLGPIRRKDHCFHGTGHFTVIPGTEASQLLDYFMHVGSFFQALPVVMQGGFGPHFVLEVSV